MYTLVQWKKMNNKYKKIIITDIKIYNLISFLFAGTL